MIGFEPPRWLPRVGCLSIGALGVTFLPQGISELLHDDSLTYLAFQVLGQQFQEWSAEVFLLWGGAAVLLTGQGRVRVFGICVMALALAAEIYSNGVRYLGSGAGGVSPLLKLTLLLPFGWLPPGKQQEDAAARESENNLTLPTRIIDRPELLS